MKNFKIVPEIDLCENVAEFLEEFSFSKYDLVFLSSSTLKYFEEKLNGATVLLRSDYGKGEPTDEMVEAIAADIKKRGIEYNRVIAVGGGTVIDVAKILSLETFSPVEKLFDKKIVPVRRKELVVIPTTCGTGSEVTNISILEFKKRQTKFGLAVPEIFPDKAILIPELLNDLPYSFFATSSIDALVHATESYLSPRASVFSRQYAENAIRMILDGYMNLAKNGKDTVKLWYKNFLLASTYAGISFGNAGTGAVHAMSYPFSGTYHVAHGEANYVLFLAVFKKYQEKAPDGDIFRLSGIIASVLGCEVESAWEKLGELLENILPFKTMSLYGTKESDIPSYVENVITKQGRLTANNYTALSKEDLEEIYKSVL